MNVSVPKLGHTLTTMSIYRVCGIDVHKHMLAVCIGAQDITEAQWITRKFSTTVQDIDHLVAWLRSHGVEEVVMESTAFYWRTVWYALERSFSKVCLAQAQSNKGPHGRKTDFKDAFRLVRRYNAKELRLSYVPEADQREQRSICHALEQRKEDRIRQRNQIEKLLEEARIKLPVSDWFGVSGRNILRALAGGKHTAEQMADFVKGQLRKRKHEILEGLQGNQMTAVGRMMLTQALDLIEVIDKQEQALQIQLAQMQKAHRHVIERLSRVPGIGVSGAQRILAAIGPEAAAFPSADQLASWVGLCPGNHISAEQSHGSRSPHGYRPLRKLMVDLAVSASKTKGCFFEGLYKRLVPSKKTMGACWAVAHRMIRLVWLLLAKRVDYVERGNQLSPRSLARKLKRTTKFLDALGYTIIPKDDLPSVALCG
jgi:transposase